MVKKVSANNAILIGCTLLAVIGHEWSHPFPNGFQIHGLSAVKFDVLKVLIFEQVKNRDKLPLDGTRIEGILLNQTDDLSMKAIKIQLFFQPLSFVIDSKPTCLLHSERLSAMKLP